MGGETTTTDPAGGLDFRQVLRLAIRTLPYLKAGRKGARTGGIIEQEGFIDASNVMLVDATSGGATRVRVRRDGDRRLRVFAKSGEDVPEPARS